MFKIDFLISFPNDKKEITISGGWPETRPLPAIGDFIYLCQESPEYKIYRVMVQSLVPIYAESIQKVSFVPGSEVPVLVKWVYVFAEAAPLPKEEEKVRPLLRLVKS